MRLHLSIDVYPTNARWPFLTPIATATTIETTASSGHCMSTKATDTVYLVTLAAIPLAP